MEKNTVLLSVEDYNGLRDFRKKIEEGNAYRFYSARFGGGLYEYMSTDAAFIEIKKIHEELHDEIDELRDPKNKPPSIDDFRSMGYLELLRWKRGLRKGL